MTTAAFDSRLGEPEELGRRMARNTQLLLQAESNVGRVLDPAGGSFYVESLTEQLETAAWAAFQELEAGGGLPTVLLDGSLAASITVARDERLARVATRREPITGVTEFPDLHEAPVVRTEADLRINDPGVSRRHIQFLITPGSPPRIEVHDLGSTNGMLVDGHRVTSTRLRDGSQVRIGSTTLVVRVLEDG